MVGRWPSEPTPAIRVELAARQNAGAGAGFAADRRLLTLGLNLGLESPDSGIGCPISRSIAGVAQW